jgi:hypothetical protein
MLLFHSRQGGRSPRGPTVSAIFAPTVPSPVHNVQQPPAALSEYWRKQSRVAAPICQWGLRLFCALCVISQGTFRVEVKFYSKSSCSSRPIRLGGRPSHSGYIQRRSLAAIRSLKR